MSDNAQFRASRNLPDWRDGSDYSGIAKVGRPALAWELLRRSPDYTGAVPTKIAARPSKSDAQILPIAKQATIEQHGLLFRRRSQS
ncbi:MAG: hypothetical protein AAF249_11330 [Pseudomonadota bacterium]